MIRFRTIDPAEAEKPAKKPAVPVAPIAVPNEPEQVESEASAPKGKGLARKTPLRAKKPASAGLFRD